jgi:hypothetical protein
MIALLLFLTLATFPIQDTPPDYGEITDLKKLSAVYVSADSTEVRKYVLAELKKSPSLKIVNTSDDAQFFIDCRMVRSTHFPGIRDVQDFEMSVFTLRDGRKRIAWSETKASVRYPPTLLTRDFLNALKSYRPNDDVAQQIVGPERGQPLSQLDWCGEG